MTCPILIVDDDEDVRDLLSLQLKRRGFEVDAVGSAYSCLERLAEMSTGVIITDVEMPGMSGLELCATVRDRHPGIIAIVMSGATTPSLAARAMDSGAFRFLAKAASSSALYATLLSAMATIAATT